MSGTLTAIIFSKATGESLQRDMRGHDNEDVYRGQIDSLQNLEGLGIAVKNLSGKYMLMIETFLNRTTTARLSLMRTETREVVMQVHFDMAPVIESGILLENEYTEATMDYPVSGDDEERALKIDKKVMQLDQSRFVAIDGIFKPYIYGNKFNSHLIEALDLATRFYIEKNEAQAAREASALLKKHTLPKPAL